MAQTSDGWPGFMKRFDEWRERTGGGGGGVGEVVGRFFADWKAGATGGNGNGWRSAGTSAGHLPGGDIGALLSQRDPWPDLLRAMGEGDTKHRLFIGTNGAAGGIWTTEARRNLLILGPPR